MAALVEDGTPRIDPYHTYMIDWAQTPDGHYYSNKAPGPALVGLPVFALADLWLTHGIVDRQERDRARVSNGSGVLRVLSLLFQILPFFFLGLLVLRELGANWVAFIALFFGNTASVFLNQYFGHGMAAVCVLGLYYAVLKRKTALGTFFFGLGVLCDYSSALFLLPLLPVWWKEWKASKSRAQWVGRFLAGALLPAVAWSVYHWVCFGGLFSIANRFQNPLFVDTADRWNIGGLFFLPSIEALWGLTLGWERGLLWTQPWVLLVFTAVILDRKKLAAVWFAFSCFCLLFLMNASFGAWHGGSTPGPRYLSAGLVCMALVLSQIWGGLSAGMQKIMTASVVVSAFLQIVFLSTYLALPSENMPLWGFYWAQLQGAHAGTVIVRIAVGWTLLAVLFYRSLSKKRAF